MKFLINFLFLIFYFIHISASNFYTYCKDNLVCIQCPENSGPVSEGQCHFSNAQILHADMLPSTTELKERPSQLSKTISLMSPCNPKGPYDRCGKNAACLPSKDPCVLGRCHCLNSSYTPSRNNTFDCESLFHLDGICSNSHTVTHLLPENTRCFNGRLICKPGLEVDRDGTCQPPRFPYGDFGDFCQPPLFDCNYLKGLLCARAFDDNDEEINGEYYCRCPDNKVWKNGKCQAALYGDRCWNDEQCSVAYYRSYLTSPSFCMEGRCRCKHGFSPAALQDDFFCVESKLK